MFSLSVCLFALRVFLCVSSCMLHARIKRDDDDNIHTGYGGNKENNNSKNKRDKCLRHHFSILQRRERKSRTRLYFMPDRQIGPDWTVHGTGTVPVVSAHFAAAAAAAAAAL